MFTSLPLPEAPTMNVLAALAVKMPKMFAVCASGSVIRLPLNVSATDELT